MNDTYFTMVLVCGIAGIGVTISSIMFGPIALALGPLIAWGPSILLYYIARRTGVLKFLLPQRRGDVTVFYISKTRRIHPMVGRELLEGYIKLPGYGRIRITKNSDYQMFNRKVVIARQGVAHTVPMERAKESVDLRAKGYSDYTEAMEKEKLMTEREKATMDVQP